MPSGYETIFLVMLNLVQHLPMVVNDFKYVYFSNHYIRLFLYNALMIVAVGSTNKTKISPVKQILSKHFHPLKVVGVKVSSGVSEQPMTEMEMYQGALTRAKNALAQVADAEFGV